MMAKQSSPDVICMHDAQSALVPCSHLPGPPRGSRPIPPTGRTPRSTKEVATRESPAAAWEDAPLPSGMDPRTSKSRSVMFSERNVSIPAVGHGQLGPCAAGSAAHRRCSIRCWGLHTERGGRGAQSVGGTVARRNGGRGAYAHPEGTGGT